MGAESWRVGLNMMTRLGRLILLVPLYNYYYYSVIFVLDSLPKNNFY